MFVTSYYPFGFVLMLCCRNVYILYVYTKKYVVALSQHNHNKQKNIH